MPWHVETSDSCPATRPWAVIKDADGSISGCHASESDASDQMAALYASESKDLHDVTVTTYPADVGVETKAVTAHLEELSEEGDILIAFAKTGEVDREADYTFPEAFTEGKAAPISHFNHGSWPERGGHPPTGRGTIEVRQPVVLHRGKFFMDTTHGRDAYHTVKGMAELQQWSYGYTVLEKAAPPSGIKARRGLKAVDVHEISPVLIGAGHSTFTAAIKSLEDLTSDDLSFLENDEYTSTLLKSGPLAGLPFAEVSARVLRGIEVFTDRAGAIAEIRLKEGRKISSARLAELTGSKDRLAEAIAAIDKIIAEATPTPEGEGDEAKARLMRMRSRLAVAHLELPSLQN